MSALSMEKKQSFENLNGLRAISAIGIVMMHVLRNSTFDIQDSFMYSFITSFTDFVFLFMIISAFGCCCGYFSKILQDSFSAQQFYSNRFKKILPFFFLLVLIDFVMEPSISTLFEAIADLSLVFGFLPNIDMSVIGVGWFLGTIFVFYIAFPFVGYLMKSKLRIWIAMAIAIFYNYSIAAYFLPRDSITLPQDRSNILYSSMFFLSGCIIFLYKDALIAFTSKFRIATGLFIITLIVAYYLADFDSRFVKNLFSLLIFSSIVIYSISVKSIFLDNFILRFLSSVSLEVYLSHMMFFRIVEKLPIKDILGNGWLAYAITFLITLSLAIIFCFFVKKGISMILLRRNNNKQ